MRTTAPLGAGVVRVWRVAVAAGAGEGLWRLLSAQEREKVGRRRRESDQRLLRTAYAALRLILAGQLGIGPTDVCYRFGEHGKPELAQANSPLRFNLSHSGDLVLVAVAADRPVGVDLERTARDTDVMSLAERFFHPREAEALRAVPGDRRVAAFMRTWVRKEAYVKGQGRGLAMGLSGFAVPPPLPPPEAEPGQVEFGRRCVPAGLPESLVEMAAVDDPTAGAPSWWLRDLEPGAGYVGAVAAPGRDWSLELGELGVDAEPAR